MVKNFVQNTCIETRCVLGKIPINIGSYPGFYVPWRYLFSLPWCALISAFFHIILNIVGNYFSSKLSYQKFANLSANQAVSGCAPCKHWNDGHGHKLSSVIYQVERCGLTLSQKHVYFSPHVAILYKFRLSNSNSELGKAISLISMR